MKSRASLGSAEEQKPERKPVLVIRTERSQKFWGAVGHSSPLGILKNMKKPRKNGGELKKEAGQVFPPPFFPLSGNPASLTEGD